MLHPAGRPDHRGHRVRHPVRAGLAQAASLGGTGQHADGGRARPRGPSSCRPSRHRRGHLDRLQAQVARGQLERRRIGLLVRQLVAVDDGSNASERPLARISSSIGRGDRRSRRPSGRPPSAAPRGPPRHLRRAGAPRSRRSSPRAGPPPASGLPRGRHGGRCGASRGVELAELGLVEGQAEVLEEVPVGGQRAGEGVDEGAVPVERPGGRGDQSRGDGTGWPGSVEEPHGSDHRSRSAERVRARLPAVPESDHPAHRSASARRAAAQGGRARDRDLPGVRPTRRRMRPGRSASSSARSSSRWSSRHPRDDDRHEPVIVPRQRLRTASTSRAWPPSSASPGSGARPPARSRDLTGFVDRRRPAHRLRHDRSAWSWTRTSAATRVVWAAAGTQNAVFAVPPAALRALADAEVAPLAETPADPA